MSKVWVPRQNTQWLVFTDLDGTLLDHSDYSFSAALPALQQLKRLDIPVIPVTSKTFAELLPLRRSLENGHPFVVENGGCSFVPETYFGPSETLGHSTHGVVKSNPENESPWSDPISGERFTRVQLGPSYHKICKVKSSICSQLNHFIAGFNDLTASRIAELTGLTPAAAELAKQRVCTEPLHWTLDEDMAGQFAQLLIPYKLKLVRGGRFYHIMSHYDKGQALKRLLARYQQKFPHTQFKTLALGDSDNDSSMLQAADQGALIRRHDSSWLQHTKTTLYRSQAIGPAGWNEALQHLLLEGDQING